MSNQPVSNVELDDRSVGIFHAFAVTDDRSAALRVLTDEAVAHFGRDQLMVSNISLAASVSAPGTVAYLASGDFQIVS